MSAQDPSLAEATARKRTPSFICELPLRVAPKEERVLLARLEAARQVGATCLGEAKRRVGLVRQSRAFHQARALPTDDPGRRALFAQARAAFACSEYALHAYAARLRQSWLGTHLDSNTCQKLASRAYGAANRLLLGKARRVRFKGRHQLDTVEGKKASVGIRWCGDRVEWSGLVLPALMALSDKLFLRKRAILETIHDQFKNISQIEHSRHRSWANFLVNVIAGLIADCHQPEKPSLRLASKQLASVCA